MLLQETGLSVVNSFQRIGDGVLAFIPLIILAIIIFIVGWIIADLIGQAVNQLVKAIKLDKGLSSAGLSDVLERAGYSLDSGKFLGGLIKWFVIAVFLVASLDILGLSAVNTFLSDVVLQYLPRVIVAVLIMLVAVVIGHTLQNIVVASAKAANMKSAGFLGALTRWAVWVFAGISTLLQLGIIPQILNTIVTGVVVAFAIAFGLAFGLGGQEVAAEWLRKMKNELSDK